MRRLGETRHQIRSRLQAERNDQIVVVDLFSFQFDFLADWIDAENFGLNNFDVALFEKSQAAADVARLAFTEHDEQKRRHENMIGAAIDENHIVIGAELAPQMRRRDDAAAAAAQDDDLFSPG